MRLISTGRDALLTDDRVADAVLEYATVLARAGTADNVTIPILRDDGEADVARLLLGPASQLSIVPAGSAEGILAGSGAVVADLQRRIERYQPRPIRPDEREDVDAESAFPTFDGYV